MALKAPYPQIKHRVLGLLRLQVKHPKFAGDGCWRGQLLFYLQENLVVWREGCPQPLDGHERCRLDC
jgi:hypothetical protein